MIPISMKQKVVVQRVMKQSFQQFLPQSIEQFTPLQSLLLTKTQEQHPALQLIYPLAWIEGKGISLSLSEEVQPSA